MKILFMYPKSSGLVSYIEKDANILSAKHNISLFPFHRIRHDLPLLVKQVSQCDLVFNWFCGLHALATNLLSKILRKYSITVVGGYEVARIPEINYGQFIGGKHSFITTWGLSLTDLVFTVSEYSYRNTINNTQVSPDKVKMIYHGFSEDVFKRDQTIKKRNLVITIGNINKVSAINKGLALFVESAKVLPDVDFMLIGADKDGTGEKLKRTSSPNVIFQGGLWGESLAAVCNQAKVYVQASVHESFGCAVAEAMLCGCVPVVSNRAALPEVVGDTGFYIKSLTPEELAVKIKHALSIFHKKEEEAMKRIRDRFPLSVRKKRILEEIDGLANR